MTKEKGRKKMTMGRQIARDLKKLNRVIAKGGSVCDHFTCNRVVLNLQPAHIRRRWLSNCGSHSE